MKSLFLFLLFTVQAFAGTEILTLSSDKSIYAESETAILRASLHAKPNNANLQFDLLATLNGNPIAVDRVTDFQSFSTEKNLALGSYTLEVTLVVQDARMATDLKAAIAFYNADIAEIQEDLSTETDPEVIANLQARLLKSQNLLAAAEFQLSDIRSIVMEPKTLSFIVQ